MNELPPLEAVGLGGLALAGFWILYRVIVLVVNTLKQNSEANTKLSISIDHLKEAQKGTHVVVQQTAETVKEAATMTRQSTDVISKIFYEMLKK